MPGPLLLDRRLDCRLWGGDRLGPWLGVEDAPANLAEAWVVYEQNRVRQGPHQGRTLGELTAEYGEALVGRRSLARLGAAFPLLAKLIDAREQLSIQVHPDDAYARSREAATGFDGKTEAWYVLSAKPGADVLLGFERQVSGGEVRAAAQDGTLEGLLRREPVSAGDVLFIPPGTVHAINGGLLIFEIQQRSDLTYRLFDYGRRGPDGELRPLHLDRALDVAHLGPPPERPSPGPGARPWARSLVRCRYFELERWELAEPVRVATDGESFELFVPIEGSVTIGWRGEELRLERGDGCVVPASAGEFELTPGPGAVLLRSFVPR